MSNERARTLIFAKDLANPDWSLSVPQVAKETITKLLGIIDSQDRELRDARSYIEELNEFQNSIASRVPERYEDDVAQEAIIDRWLDDVTKPRTITTVEELDALLVGSVVSHDEGWGLTVAERHASDLSWYVTGCLQFIDPAALLPATVLHEAVTP